MTAIVLANHADETLNKLHKTAFVDALSWVEEQGTSRYVGGEQNRLVRVIYSGYIPKRHEANRSIERDTSTDEFDCHAHERNDGALLQTRATAIGGDDRTVPTRNKIY